MTQALKAKDPRDIEYWRHKARALLLPTPLAILDRANEEGRARAICEALGLALSAREDLHERCAVDAAGVHVPVTTPSWPATNAPLGGLLHPLSGTPSPGTPPVTTLDELRQEHARWHGSLLPRLECLNRASPAQAHRVYAALWQEVQHSARWLACCPGHPVLRDHTWLAHRTMASALMGARFGGGAPRLLYVHCGPVQGFITAARRTSDLWLGSYLVSYLAYQAAKAIADRCGPDSLIYPHLASLPLWRRDLEQPELASRHGLGSTDPTRVQQWLFSSQPNRFVAVVDDASARCIAAGAAQAVRERWKTMGGRVREQLEQHVDLAGFESFERQLAEHLEIDFVVQPWPDEPREVRAMLADAARKGPAPSDHETMGHLYGPVFGLGRDTLTAQRRMLAPLPCPGDTRIKCTQCARREAMGPRRQHDEFPWAARTRWDEWWAQLRERLQEQAGGNHSPPPPASEPSGDEANRGETLDFRRGEWLCAVCLTKRLVHRFDLGGRDSELGIEWRKKQQRVLLRFPSLASIASAPFRQNLRQIEDDPAVKRWLKLLDEVHDGLGFNPPGNLLPGLGTLGREARGRGMSLLEPDGTWLYSRSYDPETVRHDHDDASADPKALGRASTAFGEIRTRLGQRAKHPQGTSIRATPYYAVLVIDVDDMGQWLEGVHDRTPKLRRVLQHAGVTDPEVLGAISHDQLRPLSSSLNAEVSRRQGELATRGLREIIENRHLGRVVYSGGDDVLAFVPLHTAWCCLRDVESAFQHHEALGPAVTLSAGVAIRDWRTPLGVALHAAREAETEAKKTKGRVVLDVGIRAGAPLALRLPWRLHPTGSTIADLGAMANALVEAKRRRTNDRKKTAPLLRPSAAEILRRELDTLRHRGLSEAFAFRVRELVGEGDAVIRPWLDAMVKEHSEDESAGTAATGPERSGLHRPPGTAGQVIDFLLFLRFLAREHGGIDYGTMEPKAEEDQP